MMSRRRKIAFTATTALFLVGMLPGAIMNLAQPQFVADMSATLGIPLALLSLMGVWKLLGIVAIATRRVPRLEEWAYAGFFFDLTGAAYLHVAAGDLAGAPASLMLLGLMMVSYVLRPKRQGDVPSARGAASRPLEMSPVAS